MSKVELVPATENDMPSLLQLVNSAYRGEHSKKGWTTEANIIQGEQRTDADSLRSMMNKAGAVIMLCKEDDALRGCVYLEKQDNKLYLGMLSVDPELQGGGYGKKLLYAADEQAIRMGCEAVTMSVITVRKELIDWYKRHGYVDTGERKPFPNDERFGRPVQPLEFMILEKQIQK